MKTITQIINDRIIELEEMKTVSNDLIQNLIEEDCQTEGMFKQKYAVAARIKELKLLLKKVE